MVCVGTVTHVRDLVYMGEMVDVGKQLDLYVSNRKMFMSVSMFISAYICKFIHLCVYCTMYIAVSRECFHMRVYHHAAYLCVPHWIHYIIPTFHSYTMTNRPLTPRSAAASSPVIATEFL